MTSVISPRDCGVVLTVLGRYGGHGSKPLESRRDSPCKVETGIPALRGAKPTFGKNVGFAFCAATIGHRALQRKRSAMMGYSSTRANPETSGWLYRPKSRITRKTVIVSYIIMFALDDFRRTPCSPNRSRR